MIDRYSLLEQLSVPSAVFDSDGTLLFKNNACRAVLENLDTKEILKKAGEGGVIFVRYDKNVCCYQLSADPDGQGNTLILFHDITPFISRKSMTEIITSDESRDVSVKKIVEKNLRMASLIDTLESAILMEGSSGSLIQINNGFLKMISDIEFAELPADEYTADFFHRIIAECASDADYLEKKDKLLSGVFGDSYTDEIKFKNGRIFTRSFNQLFVGDKPKGYLWKFKDITEKRRLYRDLEYNERRFRNIFEKNLAVMLIFDPSSMKIIDANQSAMNFYGKTKDELCDMEMCDLTIVDNMDSCMNIVTTMLKEQTGRKFRAHQKTADGGIHNVELLMTPIAAQEGELLFVIVDDVHERVIYARELENINKNLIQMVEKEAVKRRRQEELLMEKSRLAEMGEMIGNIAHQWRQPLSALGFIIQDIQDAYLHGDLTEEYIDETIVKGMEQIDYMSKTIDDFRDFFKPSKLKTVFDVKRNISQVLSIFLPLVKSHGIDIYVQCKCNGKLKVMKNTDKLDFCDRHAVNIKGYANQFKQVLLNLLSNSRYAVADKKHKEIGIIMESTADTVRVMVEDSGGGIPEGIINNIFEPYFTTKDRDGGTGIGLYMSRAIVEDNLGGSMAVENTEHGCRIIIDLKRVPDDEVPA